MNYSRGSPLALRHETSGMPPTLPPRVMEAAHMPSPTPETIKIVGDFRDLPDSFYMAIARLLLAAHDADKAREKADAQMAKEET
jgi:hypothetical protein